MLSDGVILLSHVMSDAGHVMSDAGHVTILSILCFVFLDSSYVPPHLRQNSSGPAQEGGYYNAPPPGRGHYGRLPWR